MTQGARGTGGASISSGPLHRESRVRGTMFNLTCYLLAIAV